MVARLGVVFSLVLVLTLPIGSLAVPSALGGETGRQVIVVDDDGAQCPAADFDSVVGAVASAQPGALVRVCPGIYPGRITIDRPLTLLGVPEAIDALDCFADEPVGTDPTAYPILQRPAGEAGNLLTVEAPDVTVAGLVLEGATTVVPEAPSIADAAVLLRPSSAGARVRHNLVTANDLGVDLGSDGTARTRVDHNCLRDNRWGMASQRADFVDGRVDHNRTFRNGVFAYEVGWSQASTRDSSFDANVSRRDGGAVTSGAAFAVTNSSSVSIVGNDVEPVLRGVEMFGGNAAVAIDGNRITGGTLIGVQFVPGVPVTRDVIVSGNAISGFAGASGFAVGLGTDAARRPSVDGLVVEGNTLTGNNVGVSVQPNNLGVVVRGNVASGNTQYGIWSRALASGQLFQANTMLGNGIADARDDNRASNIWTGNTCVTDLPAGTICGQ